jgi:Glycoside hydrolase 123, catalytic domain/Glycoside hydrolase 123 N-terminal domain
MQIYRAIVLAVLAICSGTGLQAYAAVASTGGRTEVLNRTTKLRYRMTYKTPEIINSAGKVSVAMEGKKPAPMTAYASPLPDAEWTRAGFDDTGWSRGSVPLEVSAGGRAYRRLEAHTGFRLYVRGNFIVTNPAAVKDLRIAVEYVGGVIVLVNGKEVARGHLQSGALSKKAQAKRYPDDTFLDAKGLLTSNSKKDGKRLARRIRKLPEVVVPAGLLKKGLNIVALELYRAPISESLTKVKRQRKARILPHLGLARLKVTAASDSGVKPNAGQLKAVRVWSCGPCNMVYANDAGDVQDPVLPVTIVGARNGTFSGRLIVSAPTAIRKLKARVSDLKRKDGAQTIPASAIRIRYAERASRDKGWVQARRQPPRFDVLLDKPTPEMSALKTSRGAVATACIWVTVRVGRNTPAGEYAGKLTVSADGMAAVAVPVRITVNNWALPDSKKFSVRNNFSPSHETVALYYGVPLWSEKHLKLMGREMDMLAEIGSRMAMINVTKNYYCMGNTESMVKWIRKPDGSYKHDFTAVDKYLDTVAARMGKPWILRLNIWSERTKKNRVVSLLDPATGKLEDLIDPPTANDKECTAFWTPVMTGLRKRLEKRGWLDVTAFGYTSYTANPSKERVAHILRMWKGAKGYKTSHSNANAWKGSNGGSMQVICNEGVWGSGRLYDPNRAKGRKGRNYPMPWKATARKANLSFPREGVQNIDLLRSSFTPLAGFRAVPESCLQGSLDGIGNVGAAFWPLKRKDKRGRIQTYTQACRPQLGPGSCLYAILSPGADGPTANERYEMFREGVQLTEAMIFLQKALDSGKLPAGMAQSIRALLNARARAYLRTYRYMWPPSSLWKQYAGSGIRERDQALFDLCAKAAKATGLK